MHRTAEKMRFLDLRSGNFHPNLKMRVLKKGQNKFLGPHPQNFCVSFFWRACIFPKNGFRNRPILAETTVNVVRKWRGRKRNFCTEGPEIGHLRVGSKISHCIALPFPIHLQENKENRLIFLAFSLLDNRSLCIICND